LRLNPSAISAAVIGVVCIAAGAASICSSIYFGQAGDVTRAWSQIPLYHHENLDGFVSTLSHSTQLIGVEMAAS
jgi:hypothetical protein